MLIIGSTVIKCYEFEKMCEFWSKALGYIPREEIKPNDWVVLIDPKKEGPSISLDKTPYEQGRQRNDWHFDLYTQNREGEVARLISLGAREYKVYSHHTVLEDPDGNLFCVCQK